MNRTILKINRYMILALTALCVHSSASVWASDSSDTIGQPEPVAVWNGDFKTKTIGSYTIDENDNTIAADYSSITIAGDLGVNIDRTESLATRAGMTVIYKCSGLTVGSSVKTLGTSYAGSSSNPYNDRAGVFVAENGQVKGIWTGRTYGTAQITLVAPTGEMLIALAYQPGGDTERRGTRLCVKDGDSEYMEAYYSQPLMSSMDIVRGMTIGGSRATASTFPAAKGMVIKAVAMFEQALTLDEIAAYEFPPDEGGNSPDVGEPEEEVMIPGFFKAVKTSDSYFDTIFDVRKASGATTVLAAEELYSSMSEEYTQYAYSTYMRLEGGCRYDFTGYYDDRVFVAVGGKIVMQSGADCATVSGYYIAPSSGWYLVELRAWNRGGPGGGTEGIKYKLEHDATWQKFEDPGDGSKFRAVVGADPLPVICNTPVAVGEYGTEKVGKYRWEFRITEQGAVVESKDHGNRTPAVAPSPVGALVVPRQLSGQPVVGIGDYAFYQSSIGEMNITSIDIPETVTSYGDYVFGNGCNFEEFEFQEGVTNIGSYVLSGCSRLKRLKIPGTLEHVGSNPFKGSSSGVSIEKLELGEGLKEIGDNWFNGMLGSITELVIPSTVTNIGTRAFSGGLGGYVDSRWDYSHSVTLVLPENLKRIGDYAFANAGGIRGNLDLRSVDSIGTGAFYLCTHLTGVELPERMTYLGGEAFKDCRSLEAVRIPEGINHNINGLFYGCESLTVASLPSDLTRIGESWFSGCKKLTLTSIPEGVTTIGNSAFYSCESIRTLRLPGTLCSVGSSAFSCCFALEEITLPEKIAEIPALCFYMCSSLTNVTLKGSVETIGDNAFSYCGLANIELPDSVHSIGQSAFGDCTSLTSVNIPDGVTYIGRSAFYRNSSLTSLRFPSGCFVVPYELCYECTSLTNVVLHDAITRIDGRAFFGCSALEHVTLPASLQRIESDAFGTCMALREIVLPDTVTYIGGMAFRHCRALERLVLSKNLTEIGGAAFFNCESLREIVVPASVTRLNERQFAGGLTSLQSIRFMGYPPAVSSWSSTFGEGTADHEFTVYYPVELSTAWSGAVAEISAMGIVCHAVQPYEGYHAWLSTEQSQYAEGESTDVTIHLSNAFEGNTYAYLIAKNEDASERCEISEISCFDEAKEMQPVCIAAGETEYVITNGFTFLDGPAEPSFEVLVLTNQFSTSFSTNTIYATEPLTLTVTNLPPSVELSVSDEDRIPTELGRQELIEWAAHDIALDEAAGFSYAWWVDSRWDLRGSGTATNGSLTLSFDRLGESAVTLRVTDKDGGQTERVIRYWIDPAEYAQVTFDLGEYGERSGGGELNQTIKLGGDAVAPEVETDPDGDYVFDGWDAECTNVLSDITIHAVYRYAPVPREFRLSLSSETMSENQSSGIRFIIKRTGTPSKSLDVQLRVDREGVLDIPKSVVIPAGNSSMVLTVRPIDNSVVDGKRTVNVTCSAEKYADGAIAITVTDDEVPSVRIELDGERLREGGAVLTGRVVRDLVTDEPLTVYLSGVSTSRCRYPSSVVIPAGEESVSFEIAVIDNDTAEALANMTLRAAAAGYISDAKSFEVEDDDVPGVRLDIFPERLSESAGTKAAYATLTRVDDTKLAKAITVRLSASTENQLILPETITIPAYTMSARFSIGTVDNALDDGDRLVEVTGAVVIESCGCDGQPSSGDVIQASITIIDNDAPALSLVANPSTMREGVEHAGDLILRHNSNLAQDLEVRLSSDAEGEIVLPSSVIIPAGIGEVTIPVATLDDGVTDGGKLISVYAEDESGAFKVASTWIQVSDRNLADLSVESVTVPSTVYAGQKIGLQFEVSNVGFVSALADVDYSVHLVRGASGGVATAENKVGSGKIKGGLAVGESILVEYSAVAPTETGDWRYIVVLDSESKLSELDNLNNTAASEAMAVNATYVATVSVSAKTYMPGEKVELTGTAVMVGAAVPAVEMPVDVYIVVNGIRREYSLTTDNAGRFSMCFEPSAGEAGRYIVGACYPGAGSVVEQDYFDILGMTRSSTENIIWDITIGDTQSRTVYIRNRSLTALTGLVLSCDDVPSDCDLQYTMPETLPAGGQVSIALYATATGITSSVDYERLSLRLACNEGLEIEIPAFFHSQSLQGHLRARPASVNRTMTVDGVILVDVEIENDGAGESGELTVEIPDVPWLRAVTPTHLHSIKSGERFAITLELSPESSMGLALNSPYSGGAMIVRCKTGDSLSVPLSFTPVAETMGAIRVDAVDNNTYILPSEPHLNNATVRLSNPYTGALVATGVTGADGIWNAEGVPPGVYQLVVTAPNHESFAKEVTVDPARETKCTAFLACQIVSATWKVERKEIEDEYEVKLMLEFDTTVPSSRVRVTMPEELPILGEGESYAFTINIRNEGVIAAEWVKLTMPEIEGYEFRLSDNGMSVPAGASIDIAAVLSRPVKRRLLKATSGEEDEDGETACVRIVKVGTFDGKCGEKYPVYEYEVYFKHGLCPEHVWALAMSKAFEPIVSVYDWMPSISLPTIPSREKNDDGLKKTGELNESKKWTYERHCFNDPCTAAAVDCVISLGTCAIPVVGCVAGAILCGKDVVASKRGTKPWWRTTVNCTLSGIGCVPNPAVSCGAAGLSCLLNLRLDCEPKKMQLKMNGALGLAQTGNTERYEGESLIEAVSHLREFILAHRDRITELFGDSAWAECDSDELAMVLREILSQLENNDELSVEPFLEMMPTGITAEMMRSFVTRWNKTQTEWEKNGEQPIGDDYIDVDAICESSQRMADVAEHVELLGYDSLWTYVEAEVDKWQKEHDETVGKLCASVTLQLSQTIGMTREVFDGTLTMYNGHESEPIRDLKFDISVLDENGNERKDMFEIISNGTTGGMDDGDVFGDGVSVAASSSGSAMIRFIPKREAAPITSKVYQFGGTITYVDPMTGERATIALNAVTLTVNPSPYLKLEYFVQRDVFADDLNTPDVVEASLPAEVAVLVRNVGAGEAKNVRISSVQPEALQNDRGLAVEFSLNDFSLDSAALNGSLANLGLNRIELGTIEPNAAKVAQWWFTSSLEGHFTSLNATVAPVNSWNTPDTALVDPQVGIHKLIRSLSVDNDGLPDFLVSDSGTYGKPDLLYTSLGDVLTVFNDGRWESESVVGVESRQAIRISYKPAHAGWNYGAVVIPGISRYRVESIHRQSGGELDPRRVWITDRTFRDGNVARLEDVIHIADLCESTEAVELEISLVAKPTGIPSVKSFDIDNEIVEFNVRDSVVVEFSCAIDPSTFTVDDLVFRKQGVVFDDVSCVGIASVDGTVARFAISGLASLCTEHARYELVVQCAGIADVSGQLGSAGKSIAWTYAASESPYIVDAEGIPARPVRSLDSVVVSTSTAVDPESFSNARISLNDKDVSEFLTVKALDEGKTRFEIYGFDALHQEDGVYSLAIEGSDLCGLDGTTGVSSFVRSWTRDTTAPVLKSVSREVGMSGARIVLAFSEKLDDTTLTLDNAKLTRDGQLVAWPSTTKLEWLSDGVWSVTGFDSATLVDGTYTLSFNAEGIIDEAGNEAEGIKSVSWTVDTTPPATVQNLSTSSEYGSVETCVYTTSRDLTISGIVPEANVFVQILAKFVGGSEILLAEPEVNANLSFNALVDLPGDGNMTIIVRLTDDAGNSSDNEFNVYVDILALDATLSGVPANGEPAGTVLLTFSAEPEESSVLAAAKALIFNGDSVDIRNVTITKVDGVTYSIGGLSEYTTGYGTYIFTFDATTVKKALSGKTGCATATLAWECILQDKTPPQIAEVLFDDKSPAAAYADHEMFSQISVRFTEAVNIPALIESGLIGSALRIELLNKDNDVTGSVTADDVTWNEQSFTAMLTIDKDRVPCGRARFVIDTSLVADLSGNTLALSDGFDVISGYKAYTPSLFMRGAAYAYACPTLTDWNSDGLLDLIVGEETPEMKGKVRIYRNRGTKDNPIYDDYTYLKIGDDDVEFEAQGCVGMQVSFGGVRNASMILAASNGEIYGWRHRARNQITKEPYPMELLFDHTTDARFAALIRAQAFCYDIDGDGSDEIIVSGQNSPMFWIKRLGMGDETHVECTPLMDQHGEYLRFPEGQSHTSAILLDVNGDKIPDLVTGDTTGNVWVYLGAENGRFASLPTRIYENTETSNTRSRLAVGDIDGDGVEDILVGRKDGSILKLKGEAMLAPAVSFKRVELKSVEQALGEDLYWVDGAEGWTCQQSGESAQAFVSHESDNETTLLMARFVGEGTVTFTWSVSDANGNSSFRCVGGDSPLEKFGTFASVTQSIVVSTNGNHQFVWTFSGKGKAVISDVSFVPTSPETQVTQTSDVPIKFADIRRFANAIWKEKDGDYEATVTSIAANGKTVEENCIAGIDSSDPDAAFKAAIEVVNGVPKVSPEPDLGDQRVYTFWGRESLESGEWKVITTEDIPLWRFFKVSVEMK